MTKRRLDSDERSLWQHVTRSISPLKRKRRAVAEEVAVAPPPAEAAATPKSQAVPPSPLPVTVRPPTSRPEPAPLGRKVKRRLARDTGGIHARLDLHGMTQAEAHAALFGFLVRSQENGARLVLVITGKGARGDSERGVLKRQVPMWLRLPDFRDMVIGFETAAIVHGGEGAIYVRLRRG